MNSNEPLFSIEVMPYLVDCNPRDHLLMVAFDDDDAVHTTAAFPLQGSRPMDDAVLEIIGWSPTATSFLAIAYSDLQGLDLQPLLSAAAASNRKVVHALRAGSSRWRSYLCQRPRCCPSVGNRYSQSLTGHADYRPLPMRSADPRSWRTAMWERWQDVIVAGGASAPILSELARSLFDIPLRDAVLAQSARHEGLARPAIRSLLNEIKDRSPLPTALPAFTCGAALAYLDGEFENAKQQVNAVLAIDEYSLARLLRNGLEMRAPSSLLSRSFAHFDPIDLLAA